MTREEILKVTREVTKEGILRVMEATMIELGHNAAWWQRAKVALECIHFMGGAVVDRHELELLKGVYGFSLEDFAEPRE
jgi:hypothetical protein